MKAKFGHDNIEINKLEDLKIAYDNVISSARLRPGEPSEHLVTFFQAYYSGFEFLQTKQDFYVLAMDWFRRAAAMNVPYAEPFFDPQGHTSRGVALEDIMGGSPRCAADCGYRTQHKSITLLDDAHVTYQVLVAIEMDNVFPSRSTTRRCNEALQSGLEVQKT